MSDYCSCDDFEQPSVYDSRDIRSARKAHECTECNRAILPGESYRHIWGIWPGIDSHPMTHRICARCAVLKEFVEAHIPCACIALGEVISMAREEVENCDDPAVLRPELEALIADIEAQPKTLHEERTTK